MRFWRAEKANLSTYLIDELRRRGDYFDPVTADPAALEQARGECEIIVSSSVSPVEGELIRAMPRLRLIANYGVGYDGIDLAACAERGVLVSNTPDVLTDDVADIAVALYLTTIRNIVGLHQYTREGQWGQQAYELTTSASGLKVGMVGFGRIGQEIAKRLTVLKSLVGYFARTQRDVPYRFFPDLLEMAREVDCLIVIVNATDETYHLINAEVLQALGPQGYLINVARGSVVDTAALITALQQHQIRGAGLDVFEHEPHVEEELRRLPNVVLSPHAGSATTHSRTLMANLVLQNIDSYMDSGLLLTPVALPSC